MIKNKKIKTIAVALASILFICSCNTYEEIPELKEPITGIQTFRPVSKRNVGVPKNLIGSIAATEYCHYYKKPVKIKEIEVEIGQYVNEGDVLCTADIDSVKTQISELNGQISLLDTENAQNALIHESRLKELELQKNWTEYMKNLGYAEQKDIDNADKDLANENENYEYDKKMYEFMKKSYGESLADLNEIVSDGTLRAKKSGYVSYVKNLKEGHNAKVYENIVVVSDYEDLYIEGNVTTQSYQYSKYEAKFIRYKNQLIPITEYEYTDPEKAYAKAQGQYPTVRFKPESDIELKLGEEYNMFFYKEYSENVLAIGKDSAQSDEEGSFVYVKSSDGSLEKRYYEPGVSDTHYIEVLSGLEEGEMVLYEQTSQLPSKDETWEAVTTDYRVFNQIKGVKYEEKNAETYYNEDYGEVDTVYVIKGDEVKKGDPLVKIKIAADRGDNVKIENDIAHLKESYANECKQYDKELEDIEKDIHDKTDLINRLTPSLEDVKKRIDSGTLSEAELIQASRDKAELEYTINELYGSSSPYQGYGTVALEEEKKILAANRAISEKTYNVTLAALQNKLKDQKKKNDGSGYKTIFALEDGVVETVKVTETDTVDIGEKLVVVTASYDTYVSFPKDKSSIPLGFEMTIAGEDRDYSAVVVKGNWDSNPNVFTEKDKVYSTMSIQEKNTYAVKVDDEEFYKNMFDDYEAMVESVRYEDVIIVPNDYIQVEKDYEGTESYFVWKLENGEYVKEFVVVDGLGIYMVMQGVSEGDILAK